MLNQTTFNKLSTLVNKVEAKARYFEQTYHDPDCYGSEARQTTAEALQEVAELLAEIMVEELPAQLLTNAPRSVKRQYEAHRRRKQVRQEFIAGLAAYANRR